MIRTIKTHQVEGEKNIGAVERVVTVTVSVDKIERLDHGGGEAGGV